MANNSSEKDLEGKIREVGEKLESPPASADEILPLLDKMESFLTRVDQSPSPSMLASLQPAMSAFITKELLGHADVDVRVAVASCVSEVTRITAPDAPYSDDSMKEIFKSIVESFEKLDDFASRSFTKRVSILETVSKVRSCVVMLDLECDDLILEMFRHFLNAISIKHQENIFMSMETIMTLVIEESEEISPELASCLLNSVKKERKDKLPVSFRLGEKVIHNCAEKLKPALMNLAKDNLNSYSKFVISLCQDGSEALEESDVEASGKNVAEESKMSERTVSDELPQGSAKADEEQEVGCPEEAGSAALNGVTSAPPVATGNGESNVVEPPSPKQKAERPSLNSKKSPKEESSSHKEADSPVGESGKGKNQQAKETESSGSQEVLSDKKEEEPSQVHVADNGQDTTLQESGSRPRRGRPIKKDVVEGASDSEGMSLRQSKRKGAVNVGDTKQKSAGGKKQKNEEKAAHSDADMNDDISLKEMITPKAAEKMPEAGGSKRKRIQEKEKVAEVKKQKNLDDSIVGARIKVWWPDDQAFYSGVIDQYDPSDKRHTVIYDDGDVEVLLLKNEKWAFVEDEEKEHSDQDTRADTSRNKKAKTGSGGRSHKKETPKTRTKGVATKSKGKEAPIETPKASKSKESAGKSSQKPKSNGASTGDKSGKRKAGKS